MGRVRCGYARVSADDQNTAMQHTALKKAGCKTAFKMMVYRERRPSALLCSGV